MSDDVKVKFSGDFTDVSKGAQDASKNAGTAMGAWVTEFHGTLLKSFVGLFAVDAVFGQIKSFISGMREQLSFIREISHAIERTGVESEQFQKLAYVAREAGVSIESLGKSLQFAEVYLAKAKNGVSANIKELGSLGFATDAASIKNLKATDILKRLADATKISGQEDLVAAHVKTIFGRTGMELIPILNLGSKGIDEMSGEAKVLSKEQMVAAVALDKSIRAMERFKALTERKAAIAVAEHEYAMEFAGAETEARHAKRTRLKKEGKTGTAEDYNLNVSSEEYRKKLVESLKEKDIDLEVAGARYLQKSEEAKRAALRTEEGPEVKKQLLERAEGFRLLANQLLGLKEDEGSGGFKLGKNGQSESGLTPVLAASSLQQIGGGDIASVANIYSNNVEDNTRRTAEATEKMVAQDTPASKKITSVAK